MKKTDKKTGKPKEKPFKINATPDEVVKALFSKSKVKGK